MQILPEGRYTLISPQQPAELLELLRAHVSKPPIFEVSLGPFSPKPKTQFYGKIEGQTFQVRRAIRYNNSFQPIADGRFDFHSMGTQIIISKKMQLYVRVFCYIWLAITLAFLLMVLSVGTAQLEHPDIYIMLMTPVGMIVFFFMLTYGAFYYEARKTKLLLMDVFKAYEVDRETGYGVS